MVCSAAVNDPHVGENDVYYCDGASTRSMVSMVPLGRWWRSLQRTARGLFSGHVWLVSMALCGEGSKICRWFDMRVLMLVGMPVWWSIKRGHV